MLKPSENIYKANCCVLIGFWKLIKREITFLGHSVVKIEKKIVKLIHTNLYAEHVDFSEFRFRNGDSKMLYFPHCATKILRQIDF